MSNIKQLIVVILLLFPQLIWAIPSADGVKINMKLQQQQHEIQVVTSSKGRLFAGWTDDVSPDKPVTGWRCSYSSSKDNGATWSTPVLYKNPDYTLSANPSVAIDSQGTLYAVCMSVKEDYSKGILELSMSRDNGKTWSPWKTIVSKNNNSIPDRPKIVAADKGQLYLVFIEVNLASPEQYPIYLESSVHFIFSSDGGSTWSKEQKISTNRTDQPPTDIYGYQGAKIIKDSHNRLLVSWGGYLNNSLYFSKSDDGGKRFSQPIEIEVADLPFRVPCTEMAVDSTGQTLIMTVHEGHGIGKIYMIKSTDGGVTWSKLNPISNSGTNAAIFFDRQDQLHLMWHEFDYHWMDIKYARSLDFGETLMPSVSLAGNGYSLELDEESGEFSSMMGSYQALIEGPNNVIFAFWLDWREGAPHLFLSKW